MDQNVARVIPVGARRNAKFDLCKISRVAEGTDSPRYNGILADDHEMSTANDGRATDWTKIVTMGKDAVINSETIVLKRSLDRSLSL